MDITAIIVIALVILFFIAKFYNMYNTISKKGIKGFLRQKVIMLSVVAAIVGTFVLINPDFQFENPKEIITAYIKQVIN